MTRILHTSDLHSNYQKVLARLAEDPPDIWVDTGDFFPNKTRGNTHVEPIYQRKWAVEWTHCARRLGEVLVAKNIAMVSVGGNHDYVSLAGLITQACPKAEAYDLARPGKKSRVVVRGLKFAGFREINYLEGEWNGELHEAGFKDIVDETMAQEPDILVTHSPAARILDAIGEGHSDGISYLTTYLTYRPHQVRLHMFGHVHEDGGKTLEEMGILFSNAAKQAAGNLLELP